MRSESVWGAGHPAGVNRLRVSTHAGMMPGRALSPFVLSKKRPRTSVQGRSFIHL